jgi:hypothetical protein
MVRLATVLLGVWMAASGCASTSEQRAPGPRRYPLATQPNPQPSDNWPLAPDKAEALLQSGDFQIRSTKGAGGGVTGASKVELYSPEYDVTFSAKWKPVPSWLESWNNSPRRELATYEVQRLFLDPEDYVVPPTTLRCIAIDEYRKIFGGGDPFKDSRCVLGVLALWLDNVRIEGTLLDEARFKQDGNYANRLALFNLLTFLVDHKDGRSNNFLVSKNEADRRVFAIDNGISFDAWIWNWFVPNWNTIRVPAVPEAAVTRLRSVKDEDINRLGVVSEFRLDAQGVYRPAKAGPNLDPSTGARTAEGTVQFGLTDDEVEDVHEKFEELLTQVDSGDLPVF